VKVEMKTDKCPKLEIKKIAKGKTGKVTWFESLGLWEFEAFKF
jgi:hypothetical protein